MKTKDVRLEIDDSSFTLYVGAHIVGCETAKGDDEWKERCEDVIHLAKRAEATIVDTRGPK